MYFAMVKSKTQERFFTEGNLDGDYPNAVLQWRNLLRIGLKV
jgi:hypothetical protein